MQCLESAGIKSGFSPFSRFFSFLGKDHWSFFPLKVLELQSLDVIAGHVKGSSKMGLVLGSLFDVWWSKELCSRAFIYFARNTPIYDAC